MCSNIINVGMGRPSAPLSKIILPTTISAANVNTLNYNLYIFSSNNITIIIMRFT
jgi:hypothetical protein